MRRLVTCGVSCAAIIGMSAPTGSAQRRGPQPPPDSQASSASIVVFQDQVDFSASSGNYRPDERAAADPQGWVTAQAAKPAVANMSLAGGAIQAVDDAVTRSADSGVFYAVAAGNEGDDACKYSPARAGTHDGVLTVAATDSADEEASWSNYGNCVDMWGPGVSILSTKIGGGTATLSGTSMASPHGAGSAPLYLSGQNEPANFVEAVLKGAAVTTSNNSKDGRTIIRLYIWF